MSRPVAQPLRLFTELERQELKRVSRAPSETVIRHQRAIALLAVADGMSLIEAARAAGWRVHDTVTRLIRRFNERGLAAWTISLVAAIPAVMARLSVHALSKNCSVAPT